MKLRLQSNSIRLRLKRLEVEHLASGGCVEEKIRFGRGEVFHYVLEASCGVTRPEARFHAHGIMVEVPASTVAHWAASDEIGIESHQAAGDGEELHILIEKDFACLNGNDEQNVDTFPNPLAGSKC